MQKWILSKLLILLILGFVLCGCIEEKAGDIKIIESINPSVSLNFYDKQFNPLSVQVQGEYINISPTNLVPKTKYLLRAVNKAGDIVWGGQTIYTAWEPGDSSKPEYHEMGCEMSSGEYEMELVIIEGDSGLIEARKQFRIISKTVSDMRADSFFNSFCSTDSDMYYDCLSKLAKLGNCESKGGSEAYYCYLDLKGMLSLKTINSCGNPLSKECINTELEKIGCINASEGEIGICVNQYNWESLKKEANQYCLSEDVNNTNCLKQLALDTKRTEFCDIAKDSQEVSGCYNFIAEETNDSKLCRGNPYETGYCRAIVLKDWKECQKIVCDESCILWNIDYQRDLCTSNIGILFGDSNICLEVGVNNNDLKYLCLGVTANDSSACNEVIDSDLKNLCIEKTRTPDSSKSK